MAWLRASSWSESGPTQEELAARSGLSVRAVANLERGRTARPRRHTVARLAAALGLSGPERDELDQSARAAAQPVPGGADSDVVRPADADPLPVRTDPRQFVPRQLPPAGSHFTGRAAELAALDRLLDPAAGPAGTVLISAIGGTAGVGKTALAVYWAHRVAGRFPDGQLYVSLHGFNPSGLPVTAGEAIRGLLEALGVQPARIPSSLDALAAMYRSLLAGSCFPAS